MPEIQIAELLAAYGPMGVMLAWFAWRLERLLGRLAKEINLNSRSIIRLLERHDPEGARELSKELYHINGG